MITVKITSFSGVGQISSAVVATPVPVSVKLTGTEKRPRRRHLRLVEPSG